MYEKQIEIRWRDQDAYGHVNNAVYLTYLEEVRDEWLERTLGRVDSLSDFVIARVAIDFRQRADSGRRRHSRPVRAARDRHGRASARASRSSPGRASSPPRQKPCSWRATARPALRDRSATPSGTRSSGRPLSPSLDALFSPLAVGPVELPNRIVSTAHQTTLVHDHAPTDEFVAYHEARARGGTGLIVLEATAVHPSGLLTAHTLAGYREEIVAGYERVARRRSAVRDEALRPALPWRSRADRVRASPARGRTRSDPEPAFQGGAARPQRRGDPLDRRRVCARCGACRQGRARRRRDLGCARLPDRAVHDARAQSKVRRVG